MEDHRHHVLWGLIRRKGARNGASHAIKEWCRNGAGHAIKALFKKVPEKVPVTLFWYCNDEKRCQSRY